MFIDINNPNGPAGMDDLIKFKSNWKSSQTSTINDQLHVPKQTVTIAFKMMGTDYKYMYNVPHSFIQQV